METKLISAQKAKTLSDRFDSHNISIEELSVMITNAACFGLRSITVPERMTQLLPNGLVVFRDRRVRAAILAAGYRDFTYNNKLVISWS